MAPTRKNERIETIEEALAAVDAQLEALEILAARTRRQEDRNEIAIAIDKGLLLLDLLIRIRQQAQDDYHRRRAVEEARAYRDQTRRLTE